MTASIKISFILPLLVPHAASAQEASSYRNPYRSAPPEIPAEVTTAKIQAETFSYDPASGASMTLQVIAPPGIRLSAPSQPLVKVPPLSAEAWAAKHEAEPSELVLFSPTVVVYPGGISLVKWWNPDWTSSERELEAWVATGLESIWACGDLTVGKRRYLMMPTMHHASDRFAAVRRVPSLDEFKGPDNILMVKGNPNDLAALEPVIALLDRYDLAAVEINGAYAVQKALQKEQAEWEAAHPEPPMKMTVKFWPVQSTQYSTTPSK